MSSLVANFNQDVETLLEEMSKAVDLMDWLGVADHAHGLKGSALGIGALKLAQEARTLEQEMLEGRVGDQEDPLVRVKQAYQAVRALLKERISLPDDSPFNGGE
jgi:HPt (histidine-containing phosphotransfer) domain-containing protein